MSPVVLFTLLGLFGPLIIAALTAYIFSRTDSVLTLIIGCIADVVVVATFAAWTAENWTIYNQPGGSTIWIAIVIVWVIASFFVFISVDAMA